MATFLGVPGADIGIAFSHIVEWHFFPPPTPEEIEQDKADGEDPRTTSLLVLTLSDCDAVAVETPRTLRFRGQTADRMAAALRTRTYAC